MSLTHALAFTLLHFLWQGTVIALLLAAALAIFRRSDSRVRYAAGCAAMLLMLVSAAGTFLVLESPGRQSPHPAEALVNLAPPMVARAVAAAVSASGGTAPDYLAPLVWVWLGGVMALAIRSFGGWAVAKRWARRHTRPAETVWNDKFAALAERLAISRPVSLVVSTLAQVPAVVGWMRPIVLVPAGVFTGMTPEQVEALLAHELAHVGRHDYLINLLQTAVETLFFYHPAVWWVSRHIRSERENCCDDLAVEVCGNTLAYVRALTDLEQLRHGAPRLAMAADGGSLRQRVHRLLRIAPPVGTASAGWLPAAGIAVFVIVAAIAAQGLAQRPAEAPAPERPEQEAQPQAAANKSAAKKDSRPWLEEIEAEGLRGLTVDQLITLKIHDVDGAYIRKMRAAGFQLNADQLASFRIHEVTPEFAEEVKQTGLHDVKPDDLISLRIHEVTPEWIRKMKALGYPDLTVDDIVGMRIHEVSPEFIQEAKRRFPNIKLEQIIQLKQFGVLE